MQALVMLRSPTRAQALALDLENLGEAWQAGWTCRESVLWQRLDAGGVELLVLEDRPGLLAALAAHPPLPPPWMLCLGGAQAADCHLPLDSSIEACVDAAQALERRQGLPHLCGPLLPSLTAAAQRLLAELGLKRELRAADFLPEMVAWCAAHPPLLQSVTRRLYPCFAQRYALRPGAVERDLRSALESLWSSGSLPAIEKWFGHTVDPEKGRPTNREFLALAAEHVRRLERAASRKGQEICASIRN